MPKSRTNEIKHKLQLDSVEWFACIFSCPDLFLIVQNSFFFEEPIQICHFSPSLLQALNSSIFIGKSTHASELEILTDQIQEENTSTSFKYKL